MEILILPILIVCGHFATVSSYAAGAPSSVCINGFPKHHTQQQNTPSPFTLTATPMEYNPGDVIDIVLSSTDGSKFRGFQVRAQRVSGDMEELVGKFTEYPAEAQPQSWFPEKPGTFNCITHKDMSDKTEIKVKWTAPAKSMGDIIFSASFVQDYETFWATQNKVTITAKKPSEDFPFNGQVNAHVQFTPEEITDGCGHSKGCLLYPRKCSGKKCRYVVAHRTIPPNHDRILFEAMATDSQYLSVSFSYDRTMGKDHTITCVKDSATDTVSIQNGYNPFLYNRRNRLGDISDVSIASDGQRLYCRFTRPMLMVVEEPGVGNHTYDLNGAYYLHLAWGHIYEGTDIPGKHTHHPIVSTDIVNFVSDRGNDAITGHTLPYYYRLHAIFGILAWLVFAGMSIIIARHYRGAMRHVMCGTAVWFHTHRLLGFLILSCTIICVVLMFVKLKGEWTNYATAHAVLGLISSSLAVLMVPAGILRPGLESSYRPYFNWGHRAGGLLAIILAAITILLGFNVQLIEPLMRQQETIVIAIWICVHVIFDLLHEFKCCRPEDSEIPSTSNNKLSIQDPDPKGSGYRGQLGLLGIYFILNLVFLGISGYYIFAS